MGLALVQKVAYLCRGLIGAGVDVRVISRPKQRYLVPVTARDRGTWEGIPYRRVAGPAGELWTLCRMRRLGLVDVAISTTKNFKTLLFYAVISRALGFKLISTYHESVGAIYGDTLDARLFEKLATPIVDAMLPISDFLGDSIRARAPDLPMLKVPPVCDFQRFQRAASDRSEAYFLFCGDARYLELIQFVVASFERLGKGHDAHLYLVTSGDEDGRNNVEELVRASSRHDSIRLFGYVPYERLIELYRGARGLLIPIRPTLQDRARFPQKVAEYAASGNPIITTNHGEIGSYFRDGESALIAAGYSVQAFAEKMRFVLVEPKRADAIGQAGRAVGLREFDYASHGEKLASFLLAMVEEVRIGGMRSQPSPS